MVLNEQQLQSIIHNCLATQKGENGYYHFCRFTEEQYRVYEAESQTRAVRARCSSSVAFDFVSDTSHVSFDYHMIEQINRTYASFDLYIDGAFSDSVYFDTLPTNGKICFCIPKTAERHRITIWLPWAMNLEIANFEIADAAVLEPVIKNKRFLFFGDSITQGYDAAYSSMSYVNRLARFFDAEVLNQGVGGYYFCADSLKGTIPFSPDLIFVAYGTNDKRGDMQIYRENTEKYLARLTDLYPQKPIFVITPIWRTDISGTQSFEQIYPVIQAVCSAYSNITVVDGRKCIPHLTGFYGDKRLHPSDLGFGEYADYLIRVIAES